MPKNNLQSPRIKMPNLDLFKRQTMWRIEGGRLSSWEHYEPGQKVANAFMNPGQKNTRKS